MTSSTHKQEPPPLCILRRFERSLLVSIGDCREEDVRCAGCQQDDRGRLCASCRAPLSVRCRARGAANRPSSFTPEHLAEEIGVPPQAECVALRLAEAPR